MASDDYIKKFTAAIVFSSRMSGHIQDPVFLKKLYQSLGDLSKAHALFLGEENAHHRSELLHCAQRIMDNIDYCEHLGLVPSVPLLQTRQALLQFVEIFSSKKHKTSSDTEASRRASSKIPPHKNTEEVSDEPRLSDTQEKIFEFIRKSPNVRAKDIIDGFGLLSDRTVKRSLKELINSGLIKKKEENRAVYYFPAERN